MLRFERPGKNSGKLSLLVVLDTNEYLLAVGLVRNPSSEHLLDILIKRFPHHQIRIPRLIVEEIRRHLSPAVFRDLLSALLLFVSVDEDFEVPFELGAKYEAKGLKPADAFIAAYTEWVGAQVLVTENRHFLTRRSDLPFRVLTSEQTLKIL